MLSFHASAVHLTDGVKVQLLEIKSNVLPIPADCTSKCQPTDVSLKKPLKAVLRCLVTYVESVVEGFPDANSDTSFKLPVPTRQHMIDWVKDQEVAKKSIQVCGISSSHPDTVRNGAFQTVHRKGTIWRLMMLMKLMMILLNCAITYCYEIRNKSLGLRIYCTFSKQFNTHLHKIFDSRYN